VTEKLKVVSLFAGIGGIDLGLHLTGGFETVAVCEIEPYAQSQLKRLFPAAVLYEDVTTLDAEQLARDGIRADVLCGGFPCQDLSTSGSRLGLDGARSGLWREFFRLIRDLRPKFVIMENSPELLDGWMGDVLGPLAQIGYDAEWDCIPASAAGAPHGRDRVWAIAYPSSFGQQIKGGCLNAFSATPNDYREASGLVDAVQGNALPYVCSRHDGIPARLAEPMLHALGNAVVPQIPEQIGWAILEALRA